MRERQPGPAARHLEIAPRKSKRSLSDVAESNDSQPFELGLSLAGKYRYQSPSTGAHYPDDIDITE
jgi:hypothetical protein